MMRALFTLAFLAPAMVHAQSGAPDNASACPAVPPNLEGGDGCFVADFTDCRYDEFVWPGSDDPASYLLTCTCFSGEFFCAQQGAPAIDPSNDETCPSTFPSTGTMCTTPTSQDCQYRTDGDNIVTRCTCFDGAFACNQPSVDADPDNHENCPLKQPIITGGEACSVPEFQACRYSPFYWMDSTEVAYISQCSCFDSVFACALAGVPFANGSNNELCPSSQPTLEGGDECELSGDIDCLYNSDNVQRRCTCLFGTFACAEQTPAGSSSAAPGNHPECPSKEPEIDGKDTCTAPPNSDCLYRPFYWPGSSELTYIGRCTCSDGVFLCAEQAISSADPNNNEDCPKTKPATASECSGPSSSESCQYREDSQNVVQCTCSDDGTFTCSGAFSPDADPENHPFCPFTEPTIGNSCDEIPTDCMYREPFCGTDVTPLVSHIYKCTCMMGDFQCAEVDQQLCPSVGICFAGDATVEVQDQGVVAMKQLQIGDKVHVGKDQYEAVYSFGHYNQEMKAPFLKLQTSASTPLLISADHMVHVQSRGFVSASSLEQGDKLVDGSTGDELTIQSIRTVQAQGVFAPFTPSGKIVVNGVLASSFVALDETENLSIVFGLHVSHQWLAHTFEFPHRLMCHYLTQCSKESYTADGISTWVATPLKASQWVLEQNSMVRNSLLTVGVAVLALFAVLETFFLYPMLALGAAAAAVGVWHRRRGNQSKAL
jgi:hypothetical protein